MNLKNYFIGQPMPDKNDPKYKERYEKEVQAGKDFADKSGISYIAVRIQSYANNHKIGFLVTVFGFVFFCFILNVVNMVSVYRHSAHKSATSVQDSIIHQRMLKNDHTEATNGNTDYDFYQHK